MLKNNFFFPLIFIMTWFSSLILFGPLVLSIPLLLKQNEIITGHEALILELVVIFFIFYRLNIQKPGRFIFRRLRPLSKFQMFTLQRLKIHYSGLAKWDLRPLSPAGHFFLEGCPERQGDYFFNDRDRRYIFLSTVSEMKKIPHSMLKIQFYKTLLEGELKICHKAYKNAESRKAIYSRQAGKTAPFVRLLMRTQLAMKMLSLKGVYYFKLRPLMFLLEEWDHEENKKILLVP
jgi:hypothetical protein